MASGETYTKQERAWGVLYDHLQKVMRPLGRESVIDGDYWLLDDNWGVAQHKLHVNNLKLLDPKIVKQLQACLQGYPDWEVVVAVGPLDPGESWPEMGLIIRLHQIVDDLQRRYLPPEFQSIKY